MKKLIYILIIATGLSSFAQTGIGTTSPNANASLELGASDKGLLINRVALTATNSPLPLSNHVAGMMVYNTSIDGLSPFNVVRGMYFNTGSKWELLQPSLTGTIDSFSGTTVPDGWLRCNGQEVSRTDYDDLFAEIGETYGVGNGNTTFNVPDLRGEFIRGFDDGRGIDADAGRTLASNQDFAIENIIGKSNGGMVTVFNSMPVSFTDGVFKSIRSIKLNTNLGSGTNFDWHGRIDFDASRVVKTSTETRPRNVVMNYIIKY